MKTRSYVNPATAIYRNRVEDKDKVQIWKAFEVSRRKRPPKKLQTKKIKSANSIIHQLTQPPSLYGNKAQAASVSETDLMSDNPAYLGKRTASSAMSFGDYYFGERRHETPTTNIQKPVNDWIHNEIYLDALLVHQEDAPPATNKHAEGGTKREPTGMAHIFDHLANTARTTGILDSGATGNFLKKGVGIAT